jgi:hypothetical protein
MARHPRIYALGMIYHLMARSNNDQAVYLIPTDYDPFLPPSDHPKAAPLVALDLYPHAEPFAFLGYRGFPDRATLLVIRGEAWTIADKEHYGLAKIVTL